MAERYARHEELLESIRREFVMGQRLEKKTKAKPPRRGDPEGDGAEDLRQTLAAAKRAKRASSGRRSDRGR